MNQSDTGGALPAILLHADGRNPSLKAQPATTPPSPNHPAAAGSHWVPGPRGSERSGGRGGSCVQLPAMLGGLGCRGIPLWPWGIPGRCVPTTMHCLLAPTHLGHWDFMGPGQRPTLLTQMSQEKTRLMVYIQNSGCMSQSEHFVGGQEAASVSYSCEN